LFIISPSVLKVLEGMLKRRIWGLGMSVDQSN